MEHLECPVCSSRDVVTTSNSSGCLSCWYHGQLRYVVTNDEPSTGEE